MPYTLLIVFMVIVIAFAIVLEIVTYMVFGGWISDSESIPFLEKHLKDYELNSVNNSIMSGFSFNGPYIAKIVMSLPSKWYIEDLGTIPRWSKAHKMIEARYKELLKNVPATKKLSEY